MEALNGNGDSGNTLTSTEAELYDRQIRLWGADVQNKLRNTSVLMIGANGLGAETCKNLVLAGIKSLVVMDANSVVEQDLPPNFFLKPTSIGRNRAKEAVESLKVLNPNVVIQADMGSVYDKSPSFYSRFDVICATDGTSQIYILLNNICRIYGKHFYCGDVFGLNGYIFADIIEYDYKNESNEKFHKKYLMYDAFMNVSWSLPKTKRKSKNNAYIIVCLILIKFRDSRKRGPLRGNADDADFLQDLVNQYTMLYNIPSGILDEDNFKNVFGESGIACTTLGAALAQKIITSLKQEDVIHNLFYYDSNVLLGTNMESCRYTASVIKPIPLREIKDTEPVHGSDSEEEPEKKRRIVEHMVL